MNKKILLLGNTGTIGTAITKVFSLTYDIIGKNSRDFDAEHPEQVRKIIEEINPDIVINCVVRLGKLCEDNPEESWKINSLFVRYLAKLSNEFSFLLVHFSTVAIFPSKLKIYHTESHIPCSTHVYGVTKYASECFLKADTERYYLFRLPLVFGVSNTITNSPLITRLVRSVKEGKITKLATDIYYTPSYNIDIAKRIKEIIENEYPYGTYHICNEGDGSLYDIIKEIIDDDIKIQRASYRDFPMHKAQDIYGLIKSEKLECMRHWKEAIKDYKKELDNEIKSI
jgi:dTDP-4-dehydrorhamnose reductase